MMDRLKAQAPYIVVLLISVFLFYRATQFGFDAPGGRIGPNVWPKIILGLTMLTCVYEIVKDLLFSGDRREIPGVLESVVEESPAGQTPASDAMPPAAPPRTFPHLLIAGAVMTVAYALLVEKLGFFLCTALFLGGFMWLGRYRRPGVIVVTSLLGSFAFMFLFMKIVYVSLPLGIGVFEQASIVLMKLMGIH